MFRQKYPFIALCLIVGLILAACAPQASSPTAGDSGGEAAVAEGSSNDAILNFAYSQKPRNLNPLDSVQGVQSQLFRMIYNRLLQYDIGFFGSPSRSKFQVLRENSG
ncbi:hypothetical protein KFU94_44030 [Chloroflexi bacterium TSY]|nr:hypothetical protein [Chloroflexi bacterium TSY]